MVTWRVYLKRQKSAYMNTVTISTVQDHFKSILQIKPGLVELSDLMCISLFWFAGPISLLAGHPAMARTTSSADP